MKSYGVILISTFLLFTNVELFFFFENSKSEFQSKSVTEMKKETRGDRTRALGKTEVETGGKWGFCFTMSMVRILDREKVGKLKKLKKKLKK